MDAGYRRLQRLARVLGCSVFEVANTMYEANHDVREFYRKNADMGVLIQELKKIQQQKRDGKNEGVCAQAKSEAQTGPSSSDNAVHCQAFTIGLT
jgi:predicted TIM-barrel fold metal-dependent hydrolase